MPLWTARRASILGFLAAGLLLVIVGAFSLSQMEALSDARSLVIQTLVVRENIEIVLSLLKDAETSQRGFLITGDARDLAPYDTAIRLLPTHMTRLRTLTMANPRQQANLDKLEPFIAAKLTELGETIEIRRTRGYAAVHPIARANWSRQTMDRIRTIAASMQLEETRLYEDRAVLMEQRARRANLTNVSALIVAAALTTGATALLIRATRARDTERATRELAEAATRAKDEFVATLSHELRTPLNAIFGWARVLRRAQLDDASRQRALDVIERNTRTQAQLVEDLLDVSRIITGKLRLAPRPVDLRAVVTGAVETVRPAAGAKGVRIEVRAENTSVNVFGDPDRLQQVVWNLLTNAIRFTSDGGRIIAEVASLAGHAEIRVTDTGRGIATEFLPFVFDRFRQGDASTARTHSGLGIGLALVRHLVEMHGGTVRADSDGEGRGATFTVRLATIATAPEAALGPTLPEALPTLNETTRQLVDLRVLVVDDDDDAREAVRLMFEQAGAIVMTAGSVAEALTALDGGTIDALVSDIAMPGHDGYELIEIVRARADGVRIPAVALTAYARIEDRERALKAGFQLHVSKPIDPAAVVRAVALVTGRVGDDVAA